MKSQLRLFYLAIVFNVSDKNCISCCKNKCYVLIHLKNYFETSDFTVQLTFSSSISCCKNKCYVLIHLKNYFEKSDFTVQLTFSSSTIFLSF